MIRITVLGGSSVATPGLALALRKLSFVSDMELILQGRSNENLTIISNLCKIILRGTGAKVHHHTDLSSAVEGAGLILNQIRVGGLEGRNFDESFPQQFGLLGEETLGAGGFSNALRTIPVVLDQVRIIEKVAPKSIFVNLTNPSSLVLQAISRCSNIPAVAICDMPTNMIRLLEKLMPPLSSQRKVVYYGTNHIGWITSVRDNDTELLNKAIEMIKNQSDYPINPKWISALKVIPNPYLKYIYETDKYIQYQSKKTRAKILIETRKSMWSDYRKLTPDTSITCIEKIIESRQPHWYEEIVVPFIEAFFSPKDHNLIIQIANRSYDDKLPKHQAIELQASIGSNRIKVEEPPVLPLDCRSILEQNAAYENLAVEAIRFEDRKLAFRALVINPLVGTINKANLVLDAIWN